MAWCFFPTSASCFCGRDHDDSDRTSSTIFLAAAARGSLAPRPVNDVLPCVMMLAQARESG
jgi:hypothetical protein